MQRDEIMLTFMMVCFTMSPAIQTIRLLLARTSLFSMGKPYRNNDSGSLFTRDPLPLAISLADAACGDRVMMIGVVVAVVAVLLVGVVVSVGAVVHTAKDTAAAATALRKTAVLSSSFFHANNTVDVVVLAAAAAAAADGKELVCCWLASGAKACELYTIIKLQCRRRRKHRMVYL